MTRESLYKQENLESLSAQKVHEFQNVRTAARILYGAFDCGDISDEAFREANQKLQDIDREAARSKNALSTSDATKAERGGSNLDSFIAKVKELRKKELLVEETPLQEIVPYGKILLIDDECQKVGWNVVFDSIFGSNQMEYFEQPLQAIEFVGKNAHRISVVLLDLRLKDNNGGPSPEIGLKLLRALKGFYLDLPVIVFSGVDETIYTRECLQAGANNYYVKETAVKDRVKYYRKFKSVIKEAVSEPELRILWRRIKALPNPNQHLSKAYYFLTTPPNDYRIKLLFSTKFFKNNEAPSIHHECILQCAMAVEEWVNKQIKLHKIIYSGTRKNIRDGKLLALYSNGIIDKKKKKNINKLFDLRTEVAHPPTPGKVLNRADAFHAFNIALSIIG